MAKKSKGDNDYSNLESQIGEIGGNEQERHDLGKLDSFVIGKEKLTPEEEASMEEFIKKSRAHRMNDDEDEEVSGKTYDIMNGWIPINREKMGIRSLFYPKDWQFRVRPATVEAIKNWSSIDDSDLYTKNNLFNEVIKECVSIHTKEGAKSWAKIASWDRLWFMLIIREYTFSKGEVSIEFDEECPECGNKVHYKLEADQIHFDLPDTEDIDMNCWNQEERCWYINPKDYGLDGKMIKLFIPSLEKDTMILNWAIKQNQQGKKVSQAFLRVLPWICERASTVDDRIEKYISDAKKLYDDWDAETYEFIDSAIKNIQVTPKETLSKKCEHCGMEVHSEMTFPNGFKRLFSVQNRFTKFGKK